MGDSDRYQLLGLPHLVRVFGICLQERLVIRVVEYSGGHVAKLPDGYLVGTGNVRVEPGQLVVQAELSFIHQFEHDCYGERLRDAADADPVGAFHIRAGFDVRFALRHD